MATKHSYTGAMPELAPWTLIAPNALLDGLAGQRLLITDQARPGRVLALTIDNEEGPNWEPVDLRVRHGVLGATDGPGSVTVSRWRRLDEVARELLGDLEITHVISVPGVRWAAPPSSRNSRRLSSRRSATATKPVSTTPATSWHGWSCSRREAPRPGALLNGPRNGSPTSARPWAS